MFRFWSSFVGRGQGHIQMTGCAYIKDVSHLFCIVQVTLT